ncbi:MAG: heavy-metal-associated domain-containing protein [Chloroflexi bacterium]|nr:heavy-metal-associated domain-containing protein [Chloroflexota bacterium]
MPYREFRLPSLYGGEDVEVVENLLRQIPGVEQVELEPETKEVSLRWNDATDWEEIERQLVSMGYTPEV